MLNVCTGKNNPFVISFVEVLGWYTGVQVAVRSKDRHSMVLQSASGGMTVHSRYRRMRVLTF